MQKTVVIAGGTGLICAFVGFWLEYPPGKDRPDTFHFAVLADILDNMWRTFALFVMQTEPKPHHNWLLVIARILLPATTVSAIYLFSADYIATLWNAWRLSRMRDHTVIIGLGDRGRCFLQSSNGAVAVLDVAASVAPPQANGVEARFQIGDGRDLNMLRQVGVPQARTVLILGGADAVNLEILSGVLACRKDSRKPLRVVVRLRNRSLARQLDHEDEFARRGLGDGPPVNEEEAQIEVVAFDADRIAAQQLLLNYPLVDLADLRAQPRVHVVLIGWTSFALELMEQLARLAPYRSFDPPRVDLIVARPDDVRSELAAVQPAFLDGLTLDGTTPHPACGEQPGNTVKPVLEIHVHDLDDEAGLPTPQQIQAIEPGSHASVTAVVVTLGSDDSSAAAAMALRDRLNIEGRWQSPIFVKVELTTTLTNLLERRASLRDQADQIIPVGTLTSTCRLESLCGEREEAARALHEAYLQSKNVTNVPLDKRAPNEMPWPLLGQTYRIANRRAVDHRPVKLLSAGYLISGRPLRTPAQHRIGTGPEELEALAELEHRSWEIDRLLEGWRAGKSRDNRRRINEAIGVPYNMLDETLNRPIRQFDRDQIVVAGRMLANATGPVTVKREVRLGLLGHSYVSDTDMARITAALEREIPPFVTAHREDVVSIFTALAPGADLILTQKVCELLDRENVEYRLVVVRTLPPEMVITDFLPNLERGGRWTTKASTLPTDPQERSTRIERHLSDFLGKQRAVVIANLLPVAFTMEDWHNPLTRKRAYQRANAYLVSRCDVIIAFHDPNREEGNSGTAEALEWARNAAGIPEEEEYLPFRRRSGSTLQDIIVLA